MAVNITFPELKETQSLPLASGESLVQLREEMCSQSISRDFKLQNYQRFLRRVLSPDSPTRNLLMVHGTGTGKTCTAIQIAEEFIIRPEFQDKRVLILANPAVQENFKTQIFNMSKVTIDPDGILLSKQCTGRRYLDMLLRIQSEPLKWTDKATKERMDNIAQNIIKEFYEFQGYLVFANTIKAQEEQGNFDSWVHKNFDNRLIIIDEAHNTKVSEDGSPQKLISDALEKVIRTANNITLILLTATPMYHDYTEIIFYFNLFLWNDRRQKNTERIQPSKIFTSNGEFHPGKEQLFRGWCQDYISYIKGDNPLTFPFRLPPPENLIAIPATRDLKNHIIKPEDRRSVLTLTASFVKGIQADVISDLNNIRLGIGGAEPTLCVFPKNQTFRKTFNISQDDDSEYSYSANTPKFLAPSKIEEHSSKFALIMKIIEESKGLIFVYSNLVEFGAQLFSMCLEEHGYESASSSKLLSSTSGEVNRGSKGRYALFTSKTSDSDIKKLFDRIKSQDNKEGKDIKVIVASRKISEGVDFQYIRQVHILEYWWNMSRIEQSVGRAIRTCSHQALPFQDQNCTVYLHVCKIPDSKRETIDEFYYRTAVEERARSIAKVKQVIMESAMDCPLQADINNLPKEWQELPVTQRRSQNDEEVTFTLSEMASPMFGTGPITCTKREYKEEDHERPLSSYIDVRDELLDIFMKLFLKKPVWKKDDLLKSPKLKMYNHDVIVYTLQNAIESGFQVKDINGRIGNIESKDDMYAFTLGKYNSLQDRYIKQDTGKKISLNAKEVEKTLGTLEEKRQSTKFPANIKNRFSQKVIDWYIVDHILTPEERIQHILEQDWDNPPFYVVQTQHLRILGSKQIYNHDNEKIVPVGEQADEYSTWLKERMANFRSHKTDYFATMNKNRDIIFNLDNTATTLQRAERSNNLSGRACTSYDLNLLSLFAEWLGDPFPKTVSVKTERCRYISLLIREAIFNKKQGIVWIPPEEWSILNEPENNKTLRS